ncbi:hypothetical protein [Lewinella sp. IMCC34183]|uniref:hypothetical protein n=1 Tax=Lewinella sp. IMCC34183 TaxID=2248762 RepID=UPI000E28625F|nr:hypothetical protein [Lewinella sp. IMCC34183]
MYSQPVTAHNEDYAAFRRISWGAVFAGALLAVAVAFALNLLGLGIGLSTINPAAESDPLAGIGTGAIIWYVISMLLALFAGGYVAGRLAGFPKASTAGLHGLLAWALFTIFSLYLLNSAVGAAFNVVGSTLSTVTSAAGSAVGAVVPDDLGQRVRSELQEVDISLDDIRNEAMQILEDTGKPALDPTNLEDRAGSAAETARQGVERATENPLSAAREISAVIDRIGQKGEAVVEAADRQALVNVLTERTDMTAAEADETVGEWVEQYETAVSTVNTKLDQLGQTAQQVGGDVAGTASTVAIIGFFALLVGAAAGFFGGTIGRQKDLTGTDGTSLRTREA